MSRIIERMQLMVIELRAEMEDADECENREWLEAVLESILENGSDGCTIMALGFLLEEVGE